RHYSFDLVFFQAPAPTLLYTLSLHDALPISFPRNCPCRNSECDHREVRQPASRCRRPPCRAECRRRRCLRSSLRAGAWDRASRRSEEHTSELQSQSKLVCRLLLEINKNTAP